MTIPGSALALVGMALAALTTTSAQATELINCIGQDGPEVVIALHSRTAFGRDLSCINAKFIADMTPCAPAGGFGLSAPTGDARLVGVVMDWRAFADHSGGVTAFLSDEAQYTFIGGHKPLDRGIKEEWRFVVSRTSGTATLTLRGSPPAQYRCQAARQRF